MPSTSRKTIRAFTASSSFGKHQSESQIENDILTFLAVKVKGGYFWKNTSGGFFDGKRFRKHTSPFAINGTSDILGVYNGRFVCIEVKSAHGKLSNAQKVFIEKVRSLGGVGTVVRSVSEVQQFFLKEFGVSLE